MYVFYRACLTLVHLLYGFVQLMRFHWLNVRRRMIPTFRGSRDDIETTKVINNIHKINKLPTHFALLLGCEEPSIADLVQILIWCLVSGIPYITIYDKNGRLKDEEQFIKKELLKCKPEFEQHIEWNLQPSVKTIKNGTNGIKHKTWIQCVSYEDGKGKITALTQDLAKAVKLGSIKVEEITLELFNNKLNPEKVPDPDLAVICGDPFTTYGFLPWHTRITEFFSLPTHHSISAMEFLNVLKRYSLCEQRYGK